MTAAEAGGAERRNGANLAAFSEHERLLVRLADELHDTCGVSEELWAELAERFSEDELLELLIIAGQYRLISYIVNGARVELEPWAARFPM